MSILLYNYKEFTECVSKVKWIEARVNSKTEEWLTRKEEEKQEEREEMPTTLETVFINNKIAES